MKCLVCSVCNKRTNGKRCCVKPLPFRVFDGEGRTLPNGKHLFIMLSCYDGETFDYVINENGLTTMECFDFLVRKRKRAIPVWFSFGYDVNKILEHIPLFGEEHSRAELWRTTETKWNGWSIRYVPRKFFELWNPYGHWRYSSCDTFGFYQMSFLSACKEWGIDATKIVAGKEERGDFNEWELSDILAYNKEELRLAWILTNKLRQALYEVNLRPNQWHGPGAIASAWLTREGIRRHYALAPYPEEMERAIHHAYFGGRIDVASIGEVVLHKYDVASAYPAALTHCISLRDIQWNLETSPATLDEHGLYHVVWDIPYREKVRIYYDDTEYYNKHYPLPWRQKDGKVLFPKDGEGWYWGVEVIAAMKAFPLGITVVEGYVPHGVKAYPFREAITRDYGARAELKAQEKPAHLAIKLALNSIYGKLCQHKTPMKRKQKRPTWQSFIWAGFITAYTRAKILDVMAEVGIENVVQIATDGIGTLVPIKHSFPKPAPLGEWEREGLCKTLILGPGIYAVIGGNVYKSRGMPAKINYGHVLREWGCTTIENTEGINDVKSTHSMFIGMGRAIHQKKTCGVFVDDTRRFQNPTFFGTSKRTPMLPAFMSHNKTWKQFDLRPRARRKDAPMLSAVYEYNAEKDPADLQE